jgi:hypothetical protein
MTLVSCHICGKRMELKDCIDTDTGRFCGDCYREITRELTDEERERSSVVLWGHGFGTSSLWGFGIFQAIMLLVLVASPGTDSLMFFGAALSSSVAYALGVLMEVYSVRRRIVLILAVFLEVTAALLWIAGWFLIPTTRGVPQFPIGAIASIPGFLSALATIDNLIKAYEGAQE